MDQITFSKVSEVQGWLKNMKDEDRPNLDKQSITLDRPGYGAGAFNSNTGIVEFTGGGAISKTKARPAKGVAPTVEPEELDAPKKPVLIKPAPGTVCPGDKTTTVTEAIRIPVPGVVTIIDPTVARKMLSTEAYHSYLIGALLVEICSDPDILLGHPRLITIINEMKMRD